MDRDRERLLALRDRVVALKERLQAEQTPGLADGRIRTGISVALSHGGEGFFGLRASEDAGNVFNGICSEVDALADEYRAFVGDALGLAGAGPARIEAWKRRLPHPYMMTEVAKAFELALGMILGETPADREFRRFYVLAGKFSRAARRSRSGTAWTSVSSPRRPVPEYDAEASALRDALRAQFERLEPRFVRLMDDRLRRYRPITFATDLSPPGRENSEEKRRRVADMNRRVLDEAKACQSGEVTMAVAMALLATDDPDRMCDRAGLIVHASRLYFDEGTPLLTLDSDEAGNLTELRVPEPEPPTLQ